MQDHTCTAPKPMQQWAEYGTTHPLQQVPPCMKPDLTRMWVKYSTTHPPEWVPPCAKICPMRVWMKPPCSAYVRSSQKFRGSSPMQCYHTHGDYLYWHGRHYGSFIIGLLSGPNTHNPTKRTWENNDPPTKRIPNGTKCVVILSLSSGPNTCDPAERTWENDNPPTK
ncbi:hypothetical protein BS47DRAFT_1359825 [Hydnum rufescens UP504]|uniref:Uncharacterized protein n=1 Tax=Hydnum rufescens UP504 TaxID=1448309 RepID=A0A9P6E0H3_9AGAM|nr:hypothetical protein BS47DRAFT_1359825 [Hydnum rufescens UP504]